MTSAGIVTTPKLYKYQEEDVERMFGSEAHLLANEMGTGKTYITLGELRRRDYEDLRVLIICPKTVIPVWIEHIHMFFPGSEVHFTAPQVPLAPLSVESFYVTNYEQIRLNENWSKVHWTYVICDEAHYLKNRKTKRTKAVKKLKAKYKRALTGTPVINRPDELWSLLNWLRPQQYRSYWRFFEMYVNYWQHPTMGYKKVLGPKNTDDLRVELDTLMTRRTKTEVLKELPPKYYTRIPVTLGMQQRRAYEEMRKDALAWVGEHENEPLPAPVVIAQLTRLRQFSSAYAHVDDTGVVQLEEPSAKLDALMEIIEGTDQPIVVYTMFKQMVKLAINRFEKEGISWVSITGDVNDADRGWAVEKFQGGDVRVFIGTIGAGGVGITLHRASTVCFLDRSWSPADNTQAEDRLHRIGQKNAVQVISLQADNTVDQTIEERLELKWSWIKQILGSTNT